VDQYREGRLIRSVWLDPAADFLVRVRMFSESGDTSYTAEFADPVRVGEGVRLLPQRIALTGISFPRLTLRYSNLRKITDDNRTDFPLALPEGIIPVSLD